MISCEISSFVTAANRESILHLERDSENLGGGLVIGNKQSNAIGCGHLMVISEIKVTTGFLVMIDSIQNIYYTITIVHTNRLCGPPVMSLDGWQLLLED